MSTSMPSTPSEPEPPESGLGLRDELYWILPIGITLVGGVAFLLINQNWGANVAAILALPVEVAGVVFAVLTAKGVGGLGGARKPRIPRNRRRITVYLSVLILAVSGVVYYFVREPDPYEFLSGDVRIGYVEPGYPGWHEGNGLGRHGFNVSVAQALLDYFPKMTSIQWVPLEDNDDRIAALTGDNPVQLVISNFSMTEARKELIDFAGPYFNDVEGFATHDSTAETVHDIHRVCVPSGSTAELRLRKLGYDVVVEPTLRACFQRFFSGSEPDLAVSTDLAIIQAYVGSLPPDKRKEVPRFLSVGVEQYGVGLPNNSPKLCAKVNEALSQFLRLGWSNAFKATLGQLGLKEIDTVHSIEHRPERTDPCEPAAPWRK
ncbi:transporter substrate-binding domain-containing protein [Catellatospora sp. TT07R-123]|uniref:transporter substrate-binding domain-containing protein n=1 Tax=Catellatospora sp. TT07R-123 TaxID=2733863 RepID=UPI001BB43196|nr:transporter substrate-binding domain-containing protein [Catellatospora sp. TT07R-123]